jgi:hypothetical protein
VTFKGEYQVIRIWSQKITRRSTVYFKNAKDLYPFESQMAKDQHCYQIVSNLRIIFPRYNNVCVLTKEVQKSEIRETKFVSYL